MSKTSQTPVTKYSRGVRLTLQHLVGEDNAHALNAVKTVAATAAFQDTREDRGVDKFSFVIPVVGSGGVASEFVGAAGTIIGGPVAYMPFALPPFQQRFNYGNGVAGNYRSLEDPQYRCILDELSLSIDQRGEPFAVVGPGSASAAGLLTAADMNRYDMVLRLMQRTPYLISRSAAVGIDNRQDATEVLRFDIDGVVVFGAGTNGAGISRLNPVVVTDLATPLDPFAVYFWELSCPGLYSTAGVGTREQWQCTVAGAFVPGNIATLTINGVPYSHTVIGGDTATTVATAIVVLARFDPLYAVTSAVGVITLISHTSGSVAAVTSAFNVGPGTFVAVNTVPRVLGTVEQLALVHLNVMATTLSPLTEKDTVILNSSGVNNPVSNLPTGHLGFQTGYNIPLTAPAANAIVTGTDVQTALHGADLALRQRAASGYGVGYGAMANEMQASAVPPRSLLARDSHYKTIVVPLWGGQYRDSVRRRDIDNAGLPYTTSPWALPTEHRFVMPVPEGFVLHHAFAVWSGYSPRSTQYSRTLDGVWPTAATYLQEVSITLNSGWHGDDYRLQQLAYLRWSADPVGALPYGYNNWMVDEHLANLPGGRQLGAYRMLQVPLCWGPIPPNLAWDHRSYLQSGPPVFTGKSNTMTRARTTTASRPSAFPPTVFVDPVTAGAENTLEIRWEKDFGSLAGMTNEDVLIGQPGEFVILVGKQTLAG